MALRMNSCDMDPCKDGDDTSGNEEHDWNIVAAVSDELSNSQHIVGDETSRLRLS